MKVRARLMGAKQGAGPPDEPGPAHAFMNTAEYPREAALNDLRTADERFLAAFKGSPSAEFGARYWAAIRAWLTAAADQWNYGRDYFPDPNEVAQYVSASTGGWSGNEEIIAAMEECRSFWSSAFVAFRSGGHYIFRTQIADDADGEGQGELTAILERWATSIGIGSCLRAER